MGEGKLYKSGLKKAVRYSVGGSAISQAIMLLVAPIITRLYGPEDLGTFAVYMALGTFISMSIFFKYELAIALSRSLTTTLSVLKLCLSIGVIYCVSLTVVFYAAGEVVLDAIGLSTFSSFIMLIPFLAFTLGLMCLIQFWLVKAARFDILGSCKIALSALLSLIQVLLGFLKVGGVGLIIGHFIGLTIVVFGLIWFVFRRYFFALPRIKLGKIKQAAIRFNNFPKYTILSDSLMTLGGQAPPIIIASLFSLNLAGFFALAYRIVLAPVALVAEGVGKVFMAKALMVKDDGDFPLFVGSVYSSLLGVSLVPFVLLGLVATDLVSLIFGAKWMESGIYISLLIPIAFAMFVYIPMMTLYLVLEKQKYELRLQTVILIFRVTGLLVGGYFGGIFWAVLLYSLLACIGYLIAGFWIMGQSGIKFGQLFKITLMEVLISLVLLAPITLFKLYISSYYELFFESSKMGFYTLFLLTLLAVFYRARRSIQLLVEPDLANLTTTRK